MLQPACLYLVDRRVAFNVVADQDLAKRGMKRFNVFCEVFTVFEVKLFLPTLFSRAAGDVTRRTRRARSKCQTARPPVFRPSTFQPCMYSRNKAIVDDALCGRDF